MTVLRSLLFVPGNKPNMLGKALGLSPDAYVPDMERLSPPGGKGERESDDSVVPPAACSGRSAGNTAGELHSQRAT